MDLSKFDLSEEVTAAIQAEFTKETEGLRNKNEQLLGEKKSIQGSVAEQAQIAEDARQAAVKSRRGKIKSF